MARQKITTPEIIGIAINIFRNNGFHGTSMSMLAEACGLMKGSFYNHFKSKDDILLVAVKSLNDYLNERVFSIAYDETMPAKKRMEATLDKLTAVLRSDQGGSLVGNVTLEVYNSQPEFQEVLKQYFDDWTNAFKNIFDEKFSNKQALKQARIAIQQIEGALMIDRIYDDPDILKSTIKNITAKLE